MSRFQALVERYQDAEETPGEAEELARLVRENPERVRFLYDALMLEANLFEIYAGIARVQEPPPAQRFRLTPRVVAAWAFAVFLLVGLAVLLLLGTPSAAPESRPAPAAPRPPAPPVPDPPKPRAPSSEPVPYGELHEGHGSKREEIEREYRKGLKEVERKRLEGKDAEADQKLREIEREREKQLRELERRKGDR